MGLYHSVAVAYGFEIPNDTSLDLLDEVINDAPDRLKDSVGHITVGDYERLILATRYTGVDENEVVRLGADTLASPEQLAAWEGELHDVAVRLGHADHPAPAWLAIHNYR